MNPFSLNMTKELNSFFLGYDSKNLTHFVDMTTACMLCRNPLNRLSFFAEDTTSPSASVGQGFTSCDDLFWMCHCHRHTQRTELFFSDKLEELIFLNTAQRIEHFFEHNSKFFFFFWKNVTQRIETFFMTLELNFFRRRLKELNLFFWTWLQELNFF